MKNTVRGLNIRELDWSAGFLEGEGCFRIGRTNKSGPVANAQQAQEQPLSRLQNIFGGRLYSYADKRGRKYSRWEVSGSRAIGVMFTLFQLMSPRRKEQISKAILIWKGRRPARKYRTHCPKGHHYDRNNTYISGGSRYCRICRKEVKEESRKMVVWKRYLA